MNAKILDAKFRSTGKRNVDFIEWVNEVSGQGIEASEVSQHRNGKREMSRFAKALYSVYFRLVESNLKT
jgi:hypothetical protein